MKLACVCEVTSGREMAGRHLRNQSIAFVEDSIVRADNTEVDDISSHDNNNNSVALVRTRTIPTERLPPVGEVSANFCG